MARQEVFCAHWSLWRMQWEHQTNDKSRRSPQEPLGWTWVLSWYKPCACWHWIWTWRGHLFWALWTYWKGTEEPDFSTIPSEWWKTHHKCRKKWRTTSEENNEWCEWKYLFSRKSRNAQLRNCEMEAESSRKRRKKGWSSQTHKWSKSWMMKSAS